MQLLLAQDVSAKRLAQLPIGGDVARNIPGHANIARVDLGIPVQKDLVNILTKTPCSKILIFQEVKFHPDRI
jgi:hypothetical protein